MVLLALATCAVGSLSYSPPFRGPYDVLKTPCLRSTRLKAYAKTPLCFLAYTQQVTCLCLYALSPCL